MPNILFTNKPKLSSHEVDRTFNEMKTAFVAHIESFVGGHPLFKEEDDVKITFEEKGVGSIVVYLETVSNKLVLKIPRSIATSAGSGLFLKKWNEIGVPVLDVIEEGIISDYPYMLMEHIDAPTLFETYQPEEMIEKGIYKEMGKLLRLMHTPKANGFGLVVDDRPEFNSAKEWLASKDIQDRFLYIQEHHALGTLADLIPSVFKVIENYATKHGSTYCHDDYTTGNIFATEPIIVFDPNPRFNNGFYDVGRFLMGNIAFSMPLKVNEQFLLGYFGDDTYDEQALFAYVYLASCMKVPYWHRTGKEDKLTTVFAYLEKNRHILK